MGRVAIRLVLVLMLLVVGAQAGAEEPAPYRASAMPFGLRSLDALPPNSGKPVRPAIELGLRWLAAHQGADGGWGVRAHALICDGEPVKRPAPTIGELGHDLGISALAMLAFLQTGYTHQGDHAYSETVRRALAYVRGSMDREGGLFRKPPDGAGFAGHWIIAHGLAAQALIELFGMTGDPAVGELANRALSFGRMARNPYFAWRYGIKPGDNDTAVTGVLALNQLVAGRINQAAEEAGQRPPLRIDEDAADGVQAWIDKMTDPDYGRIGYITRGSRSARYEGVHDGVGSDATETLTAVGLLMRMLIGQDYRKNGLIGKGLHLVAESPPVWNESAMTIDYWYWWYGALVWSQAPEHKGSAGWIKALHVALRDTQRRDGDVRTYTGSWQPVGVWSRVGGRVCSTALAVLALSAPLWLPTPEQRAKIRTRLFTDRKADPGIRIELLRALRAPEEGKISSGMRIALLGAARDPNAEVASAALDALSRMGKAASSAKRTLINRLAKTKDRAKRVALVWTIHKLGGHRKTFEVLATDKDPSVRFLATWVAQGAVKGPDPKVAARLQHAMNVWDLLDLARRYKVLPDSREDAQVGHALRERITYELDLPTVLDDTLGPGTHLLPIRVFEHPKAQMAMQAFLAVVDGSEPGLRDVVDSYEAAVTAVLKAAKEPEGQRVALALTALLIRRIAVYRKSWLDIDMALKDERTGLHRILGLYLAERYGALKSLGTEARPADTDLATYVVAQNLDFHVFQLALPDFPRLARLVPTAQTLRPHLGRLPAGRFHEVYEALSAHRPNSAGLERAMLALAHRRAGTGQERRAALLAYRLAIPTKPPKPGETEAAEETMGEAPQGPAPREPYYVDTTGRALRHMLVRFPDLGRDATEIELLMRWAKAEVAVDWPGAPFVVKELRQRAATHGDEDLIRRAGKIGG